MFLKTRKPYLLCITALCATLSFTALLLYAGIAAACSGGGAPCTTAPTATTTSPGSVSSSTAYVYGDVDGKGCETTYEFKYRSVGGGWQPGGGPYDLNGTLVVEWLYGLQASTTYEYTVLAFNSKGTGEGTIKTFKTAAPPHETPQPGPPIVTTEAATGITSSGATLNATVNPNGADTTYKFEYGPFKGFLFYLTPSVEIKAGAGTQKVKAELNLEAGTTYYFRVSAVNSVSKSTGSELSFTTSAPLWKAKTTPNPGSSDNYLYDVSCEPNTSVCTSVGKSVSSGVDSPIALRWNGTSWSEQTAAKKSGATHTRLLGVDCPSETRCLAVGNHQSAEGSSVLSELWNESKWSVQTTPTPAESTSSELRAIGCNNTAECTAVGSAVIGGVKKAIAMEWNSPTWTLQTVPIPAGAKSSQLDGVDCNWSNFCVAVGRYTDSGGVVKNLVMFWNAGWSLQAAADPAEAAESALLDASCTHTPNRCTAVGFWKNKAGEQFPLAYRFNGSSTWTQQSTPNPPGNKTSAFEEVSCASETSCSAVGSWIGGSSTATKTLAAIWNGSSWSIQSTYNPPFVPFTALYGVSCRSTACMAVGWSRNSSEVDTTLSEFRE